MTTNKTAIPTNSRMTQGKPPCTCGVVFFFGRMGLNFAIGEHARAGQLRMVAGIGTIVLRGRS
jgi:hypothetical protein